MISNFYVVFLTKAKVGNLFFFTVKTMKFRHEKGLNRVVESQLVLQCLALVELVCVTISTQFMSFCYNTPNF